MIFSAPVYKNSISPFFDSARSLICVHLKGTHELSSVVEDVNNFTVTEKTILVKELKPDIFVCNAISWFWYRYMVSNQINIYPFVHGYIEDIIDLVKENKLRRIPFAGPRHCK